jgi:GNAT superfamily N-acetyltransferase
VTNEPPHGLHLSRLEDTPGAAHDAARRFCLETIKEFYGFDHRTDWHLDLDSLLLTAVENHYASVHRGAFWTLRDASGTLLATAGIRHLGWKPGILEMFPGRYERGEDIASLWRVYVRKDQRGRGLGRWLTALAEDAAARLGYETMYLHATSDAAATLAFWRATGYRLIGTCDSSTHFDKRLRVGAAGEVREFV